MYRGESAVRRNEMRAMMRETFGGPTPSLVGEPKPAEATPAPTFAISGERFLVVHITAQTVTLDAAALRLLAAAAEIAPKE